ncbi:HlyD family secretion protein [Vibrio mediterranei]|uniref:HlyD family secretion protein n=1 Tax=Vibrio mediterranei TaxID=689 RepID=UPI0038CE89B9
MTEKKLDNKGVNSTRRFINYILILSVLSITISIIADRLLPSSDNVRVKGDVISITPQITGQVSKVLITANDSVSEGEPLVEIDPTDYKIAVNQAEAQVRLTGQQLGTRLAQILSAQAQLTKSIVERDNALRQGERVLLMEQKGMVSASDADKTRSLIAQTEASVLAAKAELKRAQKNLGDRGADNAEMQLSLLQLQQAQLNLERTIIRAPAAGAVSNFSLSPGNYAVSGVPLMTFVSKDNLWLEANFRENSLGNISIGDDVDISIDFAPGKVFKGKVTSLDLGVSWGEKAQAGELAIVHKQNGWLRDTQRMPVSIQITDPEAIQYLRIGGQADVVIYTNKNVFFMLLGKVWITLTSWLSYVR